MAVTKTHPIKSTLKAAIDYICNPVKTDGKLLVSSYGCAAETADIEFAWTRRHAIDKGTNLGRHLIQAFQPGEVTPEQAYEIGMQLAKEILGGRYEFVLTTHINREHVHNHLIFNAVSFTDHKHYHSNKRSYHFIRRTSDRLCQEHGLSVIIPGQDRGKSYIEHQAAQNGTSYKAKLKEAIDRLIPAVEDFEDLLRRLQREGYEIKRGKYISCRAPGQERFTRLKTLGVDYTEEALASRIAGRSRPSSQPKQQNGKISLLIDIDEKKFLFLRTHKVVLDSLMDITKGDYARFNSNTYLEVYDDIQERSLKKYEDEATARRQTQEKVETLEKTASVEIDSLKARISCMEENEKKRQEDAFNKKVSTWGWVATLILAGIPYLLLVVCIEVAKTQFSDISWRSAYGITGTFLATTIAGILFAAGKKWCFKKVRSILEKRQK